MKLQNFITPHHLRAKDRNYIGRMNDEKIHCSEVARQYEFDYWDGDRKYGYGGYTFKPGYWKPIAQAIIDEYGLTNESKVLDVGCGKAFLLYEMKQILPGLEVAGFDISKHGLADARPEVKPFLWNARAEEVPYVKSDGEIPDKFFDLVFSINTLHNLRLPELEKALPEMNRVGKKVYICLESYRTVAELFNVQCWALTCESFFTPEEWIWVYKKLGCPCDYEFIYFN